MTETQETFLSHLIELRSRLVKCLLVFAVACAPMLYYSAELYDLLAFPLMKSLPDGSRMNAIFTGMRKGVMTPVAIMRAPSGRFAINGMASRS